MKGRYFYVQFRLYLHNLCRLHKQLSRSAAFSGEKEVQIGPEIEIMAGNPCNYPFLAPADCADLDRERATSLENPSFMSHSTDRDEETYLRFKLL